MKEPMTTKTAKPKTRPKKVNPIFDLTARMRKVKLPEIVFYFEQHTGRIYPLTNLTFIPNTSHACSCAEISGVFRVTSRHGENACFENAFKVSAASCYETLTMALTAKHVYNRQQERDRFVNTHTRYNATQPKKIRLMQQYPQIVYKRLLENFSLAEDTDTTAETLKLSHYRTAARECFDEIFADIVADKFPDLVDADVVPDEDDE
jgi:hypothetical protein